MYKKGRCHIGNMNGGAISVWLRRVLRHKGEKETKWGDFETTHRKRLHTNLQAVVMCRVINGQLRFFSVGVGVGCWYLKCVFQFSCTTFVSNTFRSDK